MTRNGNPLIGACLGFIETVGTKYLNEYNVLLNKDPEPEIVKATVKAKSLYELRLGSREGHPSDSN